MHCYILNIEAIGFMVSENIILSYSPLYGKSMEANDLQGVANLDPRDMTVMNYVGDSDPAVP